MDIFNFKNKTAYKYIKKQVKIKETIKNTLVDKIKTICIIVDESRFKTEDYITKLREYLNISIDKIKIIRLEEGDDKKIEKTTESDVFYKKAFGFFGSVKDEKLQKQINTSYDLLINYCAEEMVYAQVLVCRSKAKFKIGFENKYSNFYNVSIHVNNNETETFNSEMVKYLNILNKV